MYTQKHHRCPQTMFLTFLTCLNRREKGQFYYNYIAYRLRGTGPFQKVNFRFVNLFHMYTLIEHGVYWTWGGVSSAPLLTLKFMNGYIDWSLQLFTDRFSHQLCFKITPDYEVTFFHIIQLVYKSDVLTANVCSCSHSSAILNKFHFSL